MAKKSVLLLVVFLSLHLGAKTYYVAKTGSDDNPGTEAQPWLTIGYAALQVVAGDTCWVKAGTYVEQVNFNGNAGTTAAPIVVKSFDGWNTIIEGWIDIREPHYIIEGFKIVLDSSGVAHHAVTINESGGHKGDSCTVRDCELVPIVRQHFRSIGIYVGGERGVVLDGNVIHGFGNRPNQDHGIYLQGRHCTVINNVVYDNISCGIHLYSEGVQASVDSNEVAYNVCYDNGGAGILLSGSNNWIHDNLSYHNYVAGIFLYASGNDNHSNVISNNTCCYNGGYPLYAKDAATDQIFRNNIFIGKATYALGLPARTVSNYNCVYPDGPSAFHWADSLGVGHSGTFAQYRASSGEDSHSILLDPAFVDSVAHDFHLQAGSQCVDAGDSTTPPGFDLDGIPTPQGAAVDMGAYEYHTTVESLDVGVWRIVAPTDTVDSGTAATPQAWVRNNSNTAVTFQVKLSVGTSYTSTQTVTNLAPDDSVEVRFANWTATQRGLMAVRCSTGLAGDQNRGNDTLTGSVTVRVTNACVTAIVAPTGTVDSGAMTTPQARVKNSGTAAASFPVTFRIGSGYSNSQNVTSLAPGDSTLVTFTTWNAAPRGLLAVRCSTGLAGDQNHGNDTLSGSVMVRVTSVGVTAIVVPTGTVDSSATIIPQVRVRNFGNTAATFPVKLDIGTGGAVENPHLRTDLGPYAEAAVRNLRSSVASTGVILSAKLMERAEALLQQPPSYTDTQTVTNLAPDDSVEVSFANWTAAPRGLLAVRCSTGLAGDQNRSNDTLSGSVTVRVTNVDVTAIVVPTGTVDSGATIIPQARVRNYGNTAASFPVTFRIGSFYSNSRNVTGLAPGESALVSFTTWNAVQRGTHATLCLTAPAGHSNDTLSGSVTVRVSNVGSTTILAPTGTIDSGATIIPQARVRNYGTATASFPVTFRIGSGYSNSQNVTSLAPGDSALVSFSTWSAVQRGTHATRCSTALAGDVIPTDDTLSGTVTVRSAWVTDVGVTAIVAPIDTVDSGATVTPQARVRNHGTAAASFPVTFRIGTFYSNSRNVTSLAPGDSALVSFNTWNAVQRGTQDARCSTALAGDQNHSNDAQSGSVTVRVTNVGATVIVAPNDTVDSGATIAPQVWVRNYGNTAVTFPVKLSIGTGGAVDKPHLRTEAGPYAEAGVRDFRNSVASTGFILDATPMERAETIFQQPFGYTNTQTVTDLAPGDSVEVSFADWTAAPRGLLAVRCSTGLAGDQSNGSDTLSGSVTVRVRDIGVVGIIAPTGTVDSGTVVTPQAWFRNFGTAVAAFPATMLIGTGYTNTQSVNSLAPGDSVEVSFADWTAAPRDVQAVRCSTGLAGDQSRGNDTLSGSVMVRGRELRDIGVVGINKPTGTYEPGEQVTPTATVRNYGNVPAAFDVWMLLTDPTGAQYYAESTSVTNVLPGTNRLVDAFPACTLKLIGDWTAKCSTAMAGDANPANNVLVTGFVTRSVWFEVKSIPGPPSGRPVKDGAWQAYHDATGLIYAGKGNKTGDFFSYDPVAGNWTQLHDIPLGMEAKLPRKGACGVADGSRYLYMAKGNNTLGFWRYDVTAGTWFQLAGVPAGTNKVKAGAAAVYVQDGDVGYVYLLKGGRSEFCRYNTVTYAWEVLPVAPMGAKPKWDKGSFLVYDGANTIYAHKGKYQELWAFDLPTQTWGTSSLNGMPFVGRSGRIKKSKDGGSGAWVGGCIYALKGGNTTEFWRYDAAANSWLELDTMPSYGSTGRPRRVNAGGSMCSAAGTLYALKGNKTNELWRYSLPSASAPQPSREGVMAERVAIGEWRLAISPNPLTSGIAVLRYSLPQAGLATLNVFDVAGRTVLSQTMAVGRTGTATLDLRKLEAGVYLAKVTTDGFSTTQKLVVQR